MRAKWSQRCCFASDCRSGTLAIMPALLNRRAFIAGLACFIGCSGPEKRGATGQTLVVANYPVYIDAETNRRFTEATGIAVEYHESTHPDAVVGTDVVIVDRQLADLRQGAGRPSVPWAIGMIGVAT